MKNSSLNSQFGAFACASSEGHQAGLTKREYFAGLAMQGLLANQRLSATEQEVASASVILADELLKQLENETTK